MYKLQHIMLKAPRVIIQAQHIIITKLQHMIKDVMYIL